MGEKAEYLKRPHDVFCLSTTIDLSIKSGDISSIRFQGDIKPKHMAFLLFGFLFLLISCTNKVVLRKKEYYPATQERSSCDSIRLQYFDSAKVVIDGLPIAELAFPFPNADTINQLIQSLIHNSDLTIGPKIVSVVDVIVESNDEVKCLFGMEEFSYGEEIKLIINENFIFRAKSFHDVKRLSRYSIPIKLIAK